MEKKRMSKLATKGWKYCEYCGKKLVQEGTVEPSSHDKYTGKAKVLTRLVCTSFSKSAEMEIEQDKERGKRWEARNKKGEKKERDLIEQFNNRSLIRKVWEFITLSGLDLELQIRLLRARYTHNVPYPFLASEDKEGFYLLHREEDYHFVGTIDEDGNIFKEN